MATILDISVNRAIDVNGFSVPGALATFYESGTTKVRTVYADPDTSVPHPSPVTANGAGVFPPIYDAGGGDVKVTVTDANGAVLAGYPVDPCQRVTTDTTGASSVQFEPTAEIPVTDVQAAIERVQENIIAPLAEFGIGVTGNATLISDIDATNTASGIYRYDGTTVGTFPSGVTAGAGGTVRIWRENSGNVLLILSPRGLTTQYNKRSVDGIWAQWSYVLRSVDTASDTVWAAGSSTTPYAASPANVMATVAAQAVGVGQDWQGMGVARSLGTWYTNNTGRPIVVFIVGGEFTMWSIRRVDGAQLDTNNLDVDGSDGDEVFTFVIPDGYQYRMNGNQLRSWWELR